MATLKLFLFGPPRLEQNNQPLTMSRRKVTALLIYLAVTRQPHSRDALATLFWPGSDQRAARANLRRTLYRLNQVVGDDLLTISPDTIGLNPQADLWLDVDMFQMHVNACLPAQHPAEELEAACLSRLAEAASLYRDDFMAGFTLTDSPDFDEWQFFQTESLRQMLADVLEQLVITHKNRAEFEQAIPYARRWLSLDPLHEPVHRHLMQLYAGSGQQAAALRQYQECVRLLDEEFGVPPEPETTALFESIKTRRGDSSAAIPAQPGYAVAQAGRYIPATPHNLPPQPTPFIGRHAELDALAQLLVKPGARLITIVGAGGMGKTRLALAAAERILNRKQTGPSTASPYHFSDGFFFVPLAPLNRTDQIVPALAQTLSFQLESNGRRSAQQQILDYLRHKRLLLIFDNFEHLLDGVGVVVDILQSAPSVRILTTSRERLKLHEEHVFSIQGLDYADDAAEQPSALHEAAEFFLQSLSRTTADFSVTHSEWPALFEICRLVEGMPLALELAASWVDVLPLTEIAAEIQRNLDFLETEIRNIPQRHRSMRAVFDTSWQQMDEAERNLFAQLTIFRAGFTRTAAREVTGASVQMLVKLTEKSLLQYDRARDRYFTHELLRQYGFEKLTANPTLEATIWKDYSAYYCGWLGQIKDDLRGPDQRRLMSRLIEENANILAAWEWAASQGRLELLDSALDTLGLFFEVQGRVQDGESLFGTTVKLLKQSAPSIQSGPQTITVFIQAMLWQAVFAQLLGNSRQAEQLVEGSSHLFENSDLDIDDNPAQTIRAAILLRQGLLALNSDNLKAKQCLEQSLSLFCALGAEWEMAFVLNALSELYQALGHYDQAIETAQESLSIRQERGDQRGVARSLARLSLFARHQGQTEAAIDFARKSHATYEALGHQADIADSLHNLGMTLTYIGEFAEALAALEESIALYNKLGNRLNLPIAYARAAVNALSLGAYGKVRPYTEKAISIGREVNDQSAVALAQTFTGWLFLVEESYEKARERLEESLSIFQSIGREAEMGMAVGLLGGAYRGLGNRPQAQRRLYQALQSAAAYQNFLPLTSSLPLVALMLMEQAETLPDESRKPCQQRALSLYALGNRYPPIGQAREVDDSAGRYLRPLLAGLPQEFVEEAMNKGQKLDLWPAIAELLAVLPDLGWETAG